MITRSMLRRARHTVSFALSAALIPLLATLSFAQTAIPVRQLAGHLPPLVARSQQVGRVASTEPIHLALSLPLRNQAQLDHLLNRLYDPNDPAYGHYLTPQQFTAAFGPTPADYKAVMDYAQAHGLTITGTHPNRLLLDVAGTAAQVKSAFGVQLLKYQAPDGRLFRAPAAEPVVPAELANRLAGIVGLDTAANRHPYRIIRLVHPFEIRASEKPHVIGSGPNGGLAPSDIRAAYNLNSVSANGSGQTLAVYELDGYSPSDISGYESYFGLPAVPLQNVLVDGASGTPGSNADEVTLDIEMQIALAPSASKILVYEAPLTDSGALDTYNRIATDNLASQISTCWGDYESDLTANDLNTENSIFQQMAAQGQSIFAASGDNGAYDDGRTLSVDDPGSQPYMVSVGGTTLATHGPGGAWQSETTWNGGSITNGASGGGISAKWPIPSYQSGVISSASQGSTSMRNVPDVSLNADPNSGYAIYYQGSWTLVGGTSCSAPLWAAFTALVNQYRAELGSAPIGFINPSLYTIGQSPTYASNFHDIADGSTNLYYPAVSGYDDATGWGSINATYLLPTLVSSAAHPLFRLFDPYNGWHLLTASSLEATIVVGMGWRSEGDVGLIYNNSNGAPNLIPLYRLYNNYNGDHFYTANAAESNYAQTLGYNLEGITGYVFADPAAGRRPLYRLYNWANGQHLFTESLAEYNKLPFPWHQEGIAAYTQ